MGIQRPGRSPTRPGQPTGPAASKPTTRTGSGPMQKSGGPPTTRGKVAGSSTRSVQKQTSARPAPNQAASSNPTVMIGIGVAAVLLLGIGAYVMMGGSSEKPPTHAPKGSPKAAAIDVSGLERDGLSKCNEGLALVKRNEALLMNHSLSPSQKSVLVPDLEKAKKLIGDGMGLLTQANEKSGNKYDVTQYQEAFITVRKKLMELRD